MLTSVGAHLLPNRQASDACAVWTLGPSIDCLCPHLLPAGGTRHLDPGILRAPDDSLQPDIPHRPRLFDDADRPSCSLAINHRPIPSRLQCRTRLASAPSRCPDGALAAARGIHRISAIMFAHAIGPAIFVSAALTLSIDRLRVNLAE